MIETDGTSCNDEKYIDELNDYTQLQKKNVVAKILYPCLIEQ